MANAKFAHEALQPKIGTAIWYWVPVSPGCHASSAAFALLARLKRALSGIADAFARNPTFDSTRLTLDACYMTNLVGLEDYVPGEGGKSNGIGGCGHPLIMQFLIAGEGIRLPWMQLLPF